MWPFKKKEEVIEYEDAGHVNIEIHFKSGGSEMSYNCDDTDVDQLIFYMMHAKKGELAQFGSMVMYADDIKYFTYRSNGVVKVKNKEVEDDE